MLQDIAPKHLDNTYRPETVPHMGSVVFVFRGNDVLVREGEGKLFPTYAEMNRPEVIIYLFTIGDVAFYLAEKVEAVPTGFSYTSMRKVRETKNAKQASFFALYTAYHLAAWYRANRFCGTCGETTVMGEKERSLICPHCGNTIYPRINPAVIVAIIHDGKILLTKYAGPRGYYYALVAGFTEIGETFEETAAREAMEEVGLKLKNIRYYKSQPWGSAADILAGFYADLDGTDEIHLDRMELKTAEWKRPEEVDLQPDDWSLTNEMMKRFKNGLPC